MLLVQGETHVQLLRKHSIQDGFFLSCLVVVDGDELLAQLVILDATMLSLVVTG